VCFRNNNTVFSSFSLFNTDARWAGKARIVTSVLLTLAVFTVHAIALGNVTVSLDGAEYYAIKVRTVYCISQLTPWSKVLLKALTGSQLVKKFPEYYRTQKVQYRIHMSPKPLPILSQINTVHAHIPLPKDPFYYYLSIYI